MKPIKSICVLPFALILGLGVTDSLAAQTRTVKLVENINKGAASSSPKELVEVNGTLFFAANDGVHGIELWRSGGISNTTVMVKDISTKAMPNNRTDSSLPHDLTPMADRIFFVAFEPKTGSEVWTSDGTEKGTKLVKDIMPGPNSSKPDELTRMGDKVYFVATDPDRGRELWVSDGTFSGTYIVRDMRKGSSSSSPSSLYSAGGKLYFAANGDEPKGGRLGREVWQSDGTSAGTTRRSDIYEGVGSSYPTDFTHVNGKVFFVAGDKDHGRELWGLDDKSVFMVSDIVKGTGSPQIRDLTAVDTRLYFTAQTPSMGRELWRTDGIHASTTYVADLMPGSGSSNPTQLTPLPPHPKRLVSKLVFVANGVIKENGKNKNVGAEAWVVDNGTNKVELLKDIIPTVSTRGPTQLTPVGKRIWFLALGHLYRTDGTSKGTNKLIDLAPFVLGVRELMPADGNVYLNATRNDVGAELFSIHAGGVAHIPSGSANSGSGKLDATDSVLGATTTIAASNLPPRAPLTLIAGMRARATWRLAGTKNRVYIDQNGWVVVGSFTATSLGNVSWAFRIPNNPSLLGVVALVQAGYGTNVAFEVTNPVELWVGND